MKLGLDCIPCIFRQVLEAGRMATDDETVIKEIMNDYSQLVPEIEQEELAPVLGKKAQDIVKEKTGQPDPYQKYKEKHIQRAQTLYPRVKEVVNNSDDPLFASLVAAAAGNAIDAAINLDVAVEDKIKSGIEQGFAQSSYQTFKSKLRPGVEVLIIGDNSGEAVLDKLLISQLKEAGAEVVYGVRAEAILNDVTMKEAQKIGLDQQAKLISTGSRAPGLILTEATEEFNRIYKTVDLVISKGQGNYEALSAVKRPIFFLLQAKCELVADNLQVNKGEQVFKLAN